MLCNRRVGANKSVYTVSHWISTIRYFGYMAPYRPDPSVPRGSWASVVMSCYLNPYRSDPSVLHGSWASVVISGYLAPYRPAHPYHTGPGYPYARCNAKYSETTCKRAIEENVTVSLDLVIDIFIARTSMYLHVHTIQQWIVYNIHIIIIQICKLHYTHPCIHHVKTALYKSINRFWINPNNAKFCAEY